MKKYLRFLLLLISIGLIIGFFIIYYPHIRPTNILKPSKSVNIKLNYNKIYLIPSETKEITSNEKNVSWSSEDELVATVNNGIITGISPGKTLINARLGKAKSSVEVIVTDLITLPTLNNEKEFLPCSKYSLEESNILDELLEYRIKEAGNNTRAGVVEAVRFLTLEFPYRLKYSTNNKIVTTASNENYDDGKGRYYHKGLYLHDGKKEELIGSNDESEIWGCDFYNETGTFTNGLDFLGLISWALLNAGYELVDGGVGITGIDDLGKKVEINQTLINNNQFKVGDLISKNGHTGIIIGIDGDIIYIAESLDNNLHVLVQNKKDLRKKWKYIIDMDEFYQIDGNLSNMW